MALSPQRRRIGRPKGLTLTQDFGRAADQALQHLDAQNFARHARDELRVARDSLDAISKRVERLESLCAMFALDDDD